MSKFAAYNNVDVTYKTVGETPVQASVKTLKNVSPGTYPVMVCFHGGFLITGYRNFEDWMASWRMTLAEKHKAIVITADYRLMPEAKGTDFLDDLRDLYSWIASSLSTVLPTGVKSDLSKVIACGESAGGYLAVQSALLHLYPAEITLRAVISCYGMLDIEVPHFTQDYEKNIFGAPNLPYTIVEEHIAAVKAGTAPKVVTNAVPPDRLPICLAVTGHGKYYELMGREPELFPMRNIEPAKGEMIPMWILHGRDDTVVPVQGSIDFVAKVKNLHPQADIKLSLGPGEHAFDDLATFETPWLMEGIQFLEKFWG